jgi:hypothetical protein
MNYSDITGFNVRVVNPGLEPFKGYWIAVNDSGNAGQLWNKVSWNAAVTNGCAVEVFVRAADAREDLGAEKFVGVTNGVSFPAIRGRYIEVRLGMIRDDASKQPAVYDLTLYGSSSGFAGEFYLDDTRAYEGADGIFSVNLSGAEPISYRWFRAYPWETNWVEVAGATNSTLAISNVDSWVEWTTAKVLVSNGNGESLWLGPAMLEVSPVAIEIPATGSSGAASRYPATINVFGQPTNLNNVIVTLWGLSHTHSADLNLLLVSPSGKRVILMSNVGGSNGVGNASIAFRQDADPPSETGPILQSNQYYVEYRPTNYGQKTPQIPFGLPAGAHSSDLRDLDGDNPNGDWGLYVYDDVQPGGIGQISGSWSIEFTVQ